MGNNDKSNKFIEEFIQKRNKLGIGNKKKGKQSNNNSNNNSSNNNNNNIVGMENMEVYKKDDSQFNDFVFKKEKKPKAKAPPVKNQQQNQQQNKKNKLKKEETQFKREYCECQAMVHELLGNCVSCGRIICSKEGWGPCMTCKFIMEIESYNNIEMSDMLVYAIERKDELLRRDRTPKRIIDDQNDYFQSESKWINKSQREALAKRKKELRKAKEKREMTISFDFAGRRIVVEEDSSLKGSIYDVINVEEKPQEEKRFVDNENDDIAPIFVKSKNKKPEKELKKEVLCHRKIVEMFLEENEKKEREERERHEKEETEKEKERQKKKKREMRKKLKMEQKELSRIQHEYYEDEEDLEQIATELNQATSLGDSFFDFCGVVEAWPHQSWKWSFEERKKIAQMLSEKKMNSFMLPYDANSTLEEYKDLSKFCTEKKVSLNFYFKIDVETNDANQFCETVSQLLEQVDCYHFTFSFTEVDNEKINPVLATKQSNFVNLVQKEVRKRYTSKSVKTKWFFAPSSRLFNVVEKSKKIHNKYFDIICEALHKSWNVIFHEASDSAISRTIEKNKIDTILSSLNKKVPRKFVIVDNFPANESATKENIFYLTPYSGRPNNLKEVCGMFVRPSKETPSSLLARVPVLTALDYFYDPIQYQPSRNLKANLFSLYKDEEITNGFSLLIENSISPMNNNYSSSILSKILSNISPKLLKIIKNLRSSKIEKDNVVNSFLGVSKKFFLLQVRFYRYKNLVKKKASKKDIETAKEKLNSSQKSFEQILYPDQENSKLYSESIENENDQKISKKNDSKPSPNSQQKQQEQQKKNNKK